ncbi:MAG: hypothetical protein LVQ64_03915 [Thermoplasmatales archaeon]|nr:hypothetical protein [Thermoplasmatales archaeon]
MSGVLAELALAALLAGMLVASIWDILRREVPDGCWQVMGIVGAVLGAVLLSSNSSPLGLVLWLLVAGLAVEHFFDWETPLRRRSQNAARWIELSAFVACVVAVVVAISLHGLSARGVPDAVVAALAVVVIARALYEVGALGGAADARALMAMSVLVPLSPATLLVLPAAAQQFADVVPFALNALVNGLVLVAITVPITIAALNLRHKEFSARDGFVSYTIPVGDLARRYVWVRERSERGIGRAEGAMTEEEDRQVRSGAARELAARGLDRVRVTPQIPLVAFLAAGALLAWVAGNLVANLFALR